jgi:hypothetical protein
VREKLGKLIASGGGDTPERVECGFEAALSREMGWNKDANKLVLIVGDAPPHDESIEPLLARVRGAREHPLEGGKGPVTGAPKKTVRPFVTSTVATNPAPKDVFARIASAGGGVGVVLDVPAPPGRGAPPRPAPGKPADKGKEKDKPADKGPPPPPPTAAGAPTGRARAAAVVRRPAPGAAAALRAHVLRVPRRRPVPVSGRRRCPRPTSSS